MSDCVDVKVTELSLERKRSVRVEKHKNKRYCRQMDAHVYMYRIKEQGNLLVVFGLLGILVK